MDSKLNFWILAGCCRHFKHTIGLTQRWHEPSISLLFLQICGEQKIDDNSRFSSSLCQMIFHGACGLLALLKRWRCNWYLELVSCYYPLWSWLDKRCWYVCYVSCWLGYFPGRFAIVGKRPFRSFCSRHLTFWKQKLFGPSDAIMLLSSGEGAKSFFTAPRFRWLEEKNERTNLGEVTGS